MTSFIRGSPSSSSTWSPEGKTTGSGPARNPARSPAGGSKHESAAAAAPPAKARTGKNQEAGIGKGITGLPRPAARSASEGEAKSPAAAASAVDLSKTSSGASAALRAISAMSTPPGFVTSLDSQGSTRPRIDAPSARATA